MTRKRKVLSGLGIVIGAVALVWVGFAIFREPEPSYQGKKVSEWLDMSLLVNRVKFKEAMEAMGPTAVPYLLDEFERKYRVRGNKRYRVFWGELPGFLQSWFPTPKDRILNRGNLYVYASSTDLKVPSDLLPRILHLCEKGLPVEEGGDLPWRMLDAVARYEDASAAVSALRRMLANPALATRAASILVQIGPAAKVAVPDMVAAIRHDPLLMVYHLEQMDAAAAILAIEALIAEEKAKPSPTKSPHCPPRAYLWQCLEWRLQSLKRKVEESQAGAATSGPADVTTL